MRRVGLFCSYWHTGYILLLGDVQHTTKLRTTINVAHQPDCYGCTWNKIKAGAYNFLIHKLPAVTCIYPIWFGWATQVWQYTASHPALKASSSCWSISLSCPPAHLFEGRLEKRFALMKLHKWNLQGTCIFTCKFQICNFMQKKSLCTFICLVTFAESF